MFAMNGKLKDSYKLYGNNFSVAKKDNNFVGNLHEVKKGLSSTFGISIKPVIYSFI